MSASDKHRTSPRSVFVSTASLRCRLVFRVARYVGTLSVIYEYTHTLTECSEESCSCSAERERPRLFGNINFCAVFTEARHWTRAVISWIQPSLSHFIPLRSRLMLSFHLRLHIVLRWIVGLVSGGNYQRPSLTLSLVLGLCAEGTGPMLPRGVRSFTFFSPV